MRDEHWWSVWVELVFIWFNFNSTLNSPVTIKMLPHVSVLKIIKEWSRRRRVWEVGTQTYPGQKLWGYKCTEIKIKCQFVLTMLKWRKIALAINERKFRSLTSNFFSQILRTEILSRSEFCTSLIWESNAKTILF